MKLSDELKHCLDGSGCGNCKHHEADTKFICMGLLQRAYERIKGYEELEEQGLLLKLPCKIGDTVYRPWTVGGCRVVAEFIVDDFRLIDNEWLVLVSGRNGRYIRKWNICKFGKTVFLKREQAEAELKKK